MSEMENMDSSFLTNNQPRQTFFNQEEINFSASTSQDSLDTRKRKLQENDNDALVDLTCCSSSDSWPADYDMEQYYVLHIKCQNEMKLIKIEKDAFNTMNILIKISDTFSCSFNYKTIKTNLGALLTADSFLLTVKQFMNSASFYLEIEKDFMVRQHKEQQRTPEVGRNPLMQNFQRQSENLGYPLNVQNTAGFPVDRQDAAPQVQNNLVYQNPPKRAEIENEVLPKVFNQSTILSEFLQEMSKKITTLCTSGKPGHLSVPTLQDMISLIIHFIGIISNTQPLTAKIGEDIAIVTTPQSTVPKQSVGKKHIRREKKVSKGCSTGRLKKQSAASPLQAMENQNNGVVQTKPEQPAIPIEALRVSNYQSENQYNGVAPTQPMQTAIPIEALRVSNYQSENQYNGVAPTQPMRTAIPIEALRVSNYQSENQYNGVAPTQPMQTAIPIEALRVSNYQSLDRKDILTLLLSSSQGKSILDYYEKTDDLTNAQRNELIKLIIEELVSNNIILTQHHFPILIEEICAVFPNEIKAKEYYYLPRYFSGKLYTRYFASDHWQEVCKKWSESFPMRQMDLKKYDIEEFLKSWPMISAAPKAPDLISIDFNILYPDRGDMLLNKWDEFKAKVQNYYDHNFRNLHAKEMLQLAKTTNNKNSQDYFLTILLYEALRSTIGLRLPQKTSFFDEIVEFVIHVSEQCLDSIREWLDKNSPSERRFQPVMVVVGPKKDDIVACYVYFNAVFYQLPSFIKALDFCFKLYWVLGLKYPTSCALIWTFIQEYFYDIDTFSGSKPKSLCALLDYLWKN